MAFVLNSVVALRNVSLPAPFNDGQLIQRQPPQFGLVMLPTDQNSLSVLWPDGFVQTAIDGDVLDEIVDPSSAALLGSFVRVNLAASPSSFAAAFDGVVVNVYRRDPNSSGTPSADIVLIHTQTGFWYEAFAANVVTISGG